MAKTTAPMFSFGAAGQIANSLVFARWRGIPYARRYIVPANPKSTEQTKTRSVFGFLVEAWKLMAAGAQAPWTAYATGKPFTNRNAFIGQNTQALRPGADLTDFIGSPGSGGGVPLTSFVANDGVGTITSTVVTPTPPTGWSIAAVGMVARINDDPHTSTDYTTHYAEAVAAPWEPSIAGLAAGAYQVSAWMKWTKPDGTTAYSASLNDTATVT